MVLPATMAGTGKENSMIKDITLHVFPAIMVTPNCNEAPRARLTSRSRAIVIAAPAREKSPSMSGLRQ